ncbi:MAG TPA: Mrp/NBP35 family ATP-binding protein [Bacilli bacterium]|jgi:Mrp family chromosome partitioning ATPase|nr:Mrp/NBP35 family ATP-binding protein [Bacilli bacterium]
MQHQVKKETTNDNSHVKKLIGVISGKGGVGKSYTTGMLALSLSRLGYEVGVLDADITGPSIPHMFNIKEKAYGDKTSIYPYIVDGLGIKVISAAMLLDDNEDPLIWRGLLIGDLIKQFYNTVNWGELDYLLVDFAPGTSDVAITAMQSLPLDGLVIVTTPQDMVGTIVKKAINMAKKLNVPLLGAVNNMSYMECPGCGEKIYIYGESSQAHIEEKLGIPLLGEARLIPQNVKSLDKGQFGDVDIEDFIKIAINIAKSEDKKDE